MIASRLDVLDGVAAALTIHAGLPVLVADGPMVTPGPDGLADVLPYAFLEALAGTDFERPGYTTTVVFTRFPFQVVSVGSTREQVEATAERIREAWVDENQSRPISLGSVGLVVSARDLTTGADPPDRLSDDLWSVTEGFQITVARS